MKLRFGSKGIAYAGLVAVVLAGCSSNEPKKTPSVDAAAGGAGGGAGGTRAGGSGGGGSGGGGSGGGGAGGSAADAARPDTGTTAADGPRDGTTADAAPAYPPVACTGVTSKTTAIMPAAGRNVYCAIDLGSNNAKLQVISLEPGKPLSFKDERQCRTRLGFGAMVFNTMTMMRSPLPDAQIKNLIDVMKEFQQICMLDKGMLIGTEATQWARDATNMDAVKTMVKAGTGQDIEVLTPVQEGQYGYVAATRNAPEKFSLDPGSNSFQIGWLPKGSTTIQTVSVAFGYVRGAGMFYPMTTTDTYEQARTKHVDALKTMLNAELGKLTPPTNLAMLKAQVTSTMLQPQLFIVGQDGALHLGLRGQLKPMGTWIATKAAYDARVAMETPMANATFGEITTLVMPPELTTWFTSTTAADFMTLRTGAPASEIRGLYGEKLLANTVLVDTLIKELGLTTLVLVPQEMPVGYILAKIK